MMHFLVFIRNAACVARCFALSLGLFACLCATQAVAEPVLLISIDGLRPADVLQAQQRGLHLPNLEAFLQRGAYASNVRGVLPTLTYPATPR